MMEIVNAERAGNQAFAMTDGGLVSKREHRLEHRDVSTTMVYTHVLNQSGDEECVAPPTVWGADLEV